MQQNNLSAERTVQGRGQSATLQQRIVTFVRDRGHVSYVELNRAFPETKGDVIVSSSINRNLVFWSGISDEFCDAIDAAIAAGEIHMTPSSAFVYLADGGVLNLPLLKGNPLKCKKPHWQPVVFNSGPTPKPSAAELKRFNAARKAVGLEGGQQ